MFCFINFAFIFGGGCGIRTHVTLLSNGFQDRLVMTASITLRMDIVWVGQGAPVSVPQGGALSRILSSVT